MLALRLTVFALLVCGTCGFSGYWFNLFNHCNPPEQMVGKFCVILLDNNYDGDNNVTNRDIHYDSLFYDYDGELCTMHEWELVTKWTCRFGFSEEFGRFMFNRFDIIEDGVVTEGDFGAPLSYTADNFLVMNFNLYKNLYCGDPKNRENPVDRVQCAEVDALTPEDIKCT
ncbi:uncharacterized protein LOC124286026 [Haliotis rubra]|uniref:uncharacterized protein LOC124286026 n=1 Tax=Haliotis rubra TaxID=36100 RepID=UPI001EE5F697|nr:uncharacterized protein LOC124286026 [Haliotis rubra]